jgi:predicted Zn-dependent protease
MTEGHSTAGKSIIEMLWEQADIMYAKLMQLVEDNNNWKLEDVQAALEDDALDEPEAKLTANLVVEACELRGKLSGLSYALGRMLHMYDKPKDAIDKIKAELRERWEAEEEEDE